MLYHFMRHPHQVFSRDQLLESIWGLSEYIDPSTVTVHIRRLREKIETDPSNPPTCRPSGVLATNSSRNL